MAELVSILIVLIIIGAVLYLIQNVLPLNPQIKTLIMVIVVVFACIWALQLLVAVPGHGPIFRLR